MISVPASRNLAINQCENGYWRSEAAEWQYGFSKLQQNCSERYCWISCTYNIMFDVPVSPAPMDVSVGQAIISHILNGLLFDDFSVNFFP